VTPTASEIALVVALVAVVVGALVLSARMVGVVAERFGEDPRYWQPRMLPFAFFGPVVLWLLLSHRGGPRGLA